MSRVRLIAVGAALIAGIATAVLIFRAGGPNPDELLARALAEIDGGNEGTVTDAQLVLATNPAWDLHSRLLDGRVCLRQGKFALALERLTPLPEDAHWRARYLVPAAQTLYGLGRLAEAEVLLAEALRNDPADVVAIRWLGMVYYDLGAIDHAIPQLERLVELEPEDYRPHRLLGILYLDFERYADAVRQFRAALEKSPPRDIADEIRGDLARALVSNKEYRAVEELVGEMPHGVVEMRCLARSLFAQGDLKGARRWLDRAGTVEPDNAEQFLLEGDLLQEEGHLPEAVNRLREAVQKYPVDASLRYRLSQLLRLSGEIRSANIELERWKEIQSRQGRIVKLNQDAIRFPGNREVREELARRYEELQQPEMAAMWRKSAEAIPRKRTETDGNAGSREGDSPVEPAVPDTMP